MSTHVLDSSNIAEYLDTGVVRPIEGLTPSPTGAKPVKSGSVDAAASKGGAQESKAEPKQPEKAEAKTDDDKTAAKTAEESDADDVEDENGLTPRQKRELTAKMLKAVGAKHRAMKEAEEFAGAQYSERKLAEARAEKLEREIARLQAQQQPPAAATEEAKPPSRDQFDSEEKYQDALVEFKVEQKWKARAAAEAKRQEEQRQAEVLEQATARIKAARELVPDYDEVTGSADVPVPPYVAGYMQESEMFAELGYHFAEHPEELERLSKLVPARQLVELGKIEAKLEPFSKRAKEPAKDAVKAVPNPVGDTRGRTVVPPPEPITPIPTNGAQVSKDEDHMNTRQVIEKWQAEHRANLYRRQRH